MKCIVIIIILTLCAMGILTAVIILMRNDEEPTRNEYIAVVVEYHPLEKSNSLSFTEYLLLNTAEYESLIKNASEANLKFRSFSKNLRKLFQSADIIVFPEAGLSGTHFEKSRPFLSSNLIEVPDPLDNVIPWKLSDGFCHEVLQKISKAAYIYSIYVVINVPEKYNCLSESNCPTDGFFYYNTNVVFDRQGCIIARYRKYNLFLEPEFTITKTAEICTFETDFGVTFGMFICFDLLFENPAISLLQLTSVKDIIYSAAWFSELPFLFAVGVQAGWSHSMDVNLLAANLHSRKHGGSGIFLRTNGVQVASTPKEVGTRMFLAKVPIHPELTHSLPKKIHPNPLERNPELSKISDSNLVLEFLRDPSLPSMDSKILEPSFETIYDDIDGVVFNTELSYSVAQFESSVKVQWSINKQFDAESPRYRLFAFFGDRSFSQARNATIAVCGIVACKNDTLDSCGLIPNVQSSVKTTLHNINISVRSKSLTEGYIPITSDFSIWPLSPEQFQFSKRLVMNQDKSLEYEVKMSSFKPLDDILSFAVYKIPST